MSDLGPENNVPSSSTRPDSSQSRETIERLGQEANLRAREFENETHEVGGALRDQARAAADETSREASKFAQQMKDRARGFAETRKQAGADRLTSIAGAVERAAADLESESPQAAGYVRDAADGVRHVSSMLRDRPVEQLVSDARDFARRQPALVFGGALLAGLAISRFLKSSAQANEQAEQRRAFDGGYRHDYD
jgi:hypothetical protein